MSGNTRGSQFEERVCNALRQLEQSGLAKDIRQQDYVEDRDGNQRKVDISITLRTYLVNILVSIECKSRERTITLDEVDQIKVMKSELLERNIFWLIYDGKLGENAAAALKNAGIATYEIEAFEGIVESILNAMDKWEIGFLARETAKLSRMSPMLYEIAAYRLEIALSDCFKPLPDVRSLLSQKKR